MIIPDKPGVTPWHISYASHWWYGCTGPEHGSNTTNSRPGLINTSLTPVALASCADPESCQRGCFFFFFYFEGERVQLPLKAGQYRPVSETPFKWRHLNGVLLAGRWWPNNIHFKCSLSGIRTSIAKKPYIFVIFQEGVRPPVPPLWIRTWTWPVFCFQSLFRLFLEEQALKISLNYMIISVYGENFFHLHSTQQQLLRPPNNMDNGKLDIFE